MSYTQPTVPGSYVTQQTQQKAPVITGQTGLVAINGTATDGPVNNPFFASSVRSAIASLGADTTLPHGALLEYLTYVPEGVNCVFNRVTDDTETAATMHSLDGAAQPGVVGSWVAINPGTNANAGTHRYDLRSGTMAAAPVLRATVTYPNRATEVFDGIVAYAQPGGAYDAPTFQRTMAAAANGTAKSTLRSVNWIYSQGTSTVAPQVGIVFGASGGTNGASGVGSAQLLGNDGTAQTRKGVYALSGTGFAFLLPAGLTDPTVVQTMLQFVYAERAGFLLYAFPQGTSPAQAVAIQTANALVNKRLIACLFWNQVFDTFQGQTIWVSPMGKIAGIIAGLDQADDPLNKPPVGAVGVVETEATASQGISNGDAQLLYSNGIMYLANPCCQRPVFGLPHGLASDGSDISNTRMSDSVALSAKSMLAQYVGGRQRVPLLDVSDPRPDLDPFRGLVDSAMKSLMRQYVRRGELSDGTAVCDTTNNMRSTVLAKECNVEISGITLAGVSFIKTLVMVGDQVLIQGPN